MCNKPKSPNSGMVAELIRPSLFEFINKERPSLDSKGFICFDDLGDFRKDYVKEVLQDEIGELSALDREVIESLEQQTETQKLNADFDECLDSHLVNMQHCSHGRACPPRRMSPCDLKDSSI